MQLSKGNACINAALTSAMGALHLLDDAGSTVIDVVLRGSTAVLIVDKPPPFVRGGMRSRRTVAGVRSTIRVAQWQGALIEWADRECLSQRAH